MKEFAYCTHERCRMNSAVTLWYMAMKLPMRAPDLMQKSEQALKSEVRCLDQPPEEKAA